MTDITEHSLFAIGGTPISDDQPGGENIRYEASFEQLEAELAKQESLNAETVDWQVVLNASADIIKDQSKDLLVGAYLCNALLIKEGYSGLAVGLGILDDMVENHWDHLFPPAKRMRARATAFSWLAEKAGIQLSLTPPGAADAAAVILAADKLKQLDNALVEKMGDSAPMLTDLSSPLKNFRQSAEAEAQKAEAQQAEAQPAEPTTAETPISSDDAAPAAADPGDQPGPASPAPAPVPAARAKSASSAPADASALESEADSKKILRQSQSTLRDITAFWLAQKLSDERAYRVARQACWMMIEAAPPAAEGKTQINPPAPERLTYFQSQQEKGEAAALIPELEKTLARSPFWLDGHFQVVTSLRSLGPDYDAAIKSIIRELNACLSRMPELLDLSFSDGSAFASDQTRLWIESEVMSVTDSAPRTADTDSSGGEAWSQALAEARAKASSGDNDQAMEIMNQGLASAGQLRDQFYWRCALAELMLQLGKYEAAASVLEAISEQAQSRQLDEWEPQLLAKIYRLLFQCYQKQQKSKKDDKSLKEKTAQAYAQLCWFDPVTALSVKGG